ncbi:hypothetical protein A2U01_0029723, partial [Trifolium medium]|nr:hypothetical protein [Trifolium medium]
VSSFKEDDVKVAASVNVVTMVLLCCGFGEGCCKKGVLRIDMEDEE